MLPSEGTLKPPYRRSPPGLSTPTASEYRNMVKTVEEMKAILEWFTTKGVDTHDYEQAKGFLTKLGRGGLPSISRSPRWRCACLQPSRGRVKGHTESLAGHA